MQKSFNKEQNFTISKHIVVTELDGEAVLLDNSNGQYFGLNQVGNFVFNKIKAGLNTLEVIEAMSQHYAVDKQQAETDLQELLNHMVEKDILFT